MAHRTTPLLLVPILFSCQRDADSSQGDPCPSCDFWTNDGERFAHVNNAVGHAVEGDGVVNIGEGSFVLDDWGSSIGIGWWTALSWVGRGARKREISFPPNDCGVNIDLYQKNRRILRPFDPGLSTRAGLRGRMDLRLP